DRAFQILPGTENAEFKLESAIRHRQDSISALNTPNHGTSWISAGMNLQPSSQVATQGSRCTLRVGENTQGKYQNRQQANSSLHHLKTPSPFGEVAILPVCVGLPVGIFRKYPRLVKALLLRMGNHFRSNSETSKLRCEEF